MQLSYRFVLLTLALFMHAPVSAESDVPMLTVIKVANLWLLCQMDGSFTR